MGPRRPGHRPLAVSGRAVEAVRVGCRRSAREEMADLIGRYQESAFPLIKRSVGDVFVFSRSKHYILGLLEVDVTAARQLIHRHEAETGDKVSFTAWVAKCLAQAISEHPAANSFRKGSRRVVTFADVDVLVVVEKHVGAGRFPVPYVIRKANEKTAQAIHDEVRRAQAGGFRDEGNAIGEEASRDTKNVLLRLPNPFLLPTFVRRLYWKRFRTDPFKVKRVMGTAGITAVGMFGPGGGWPVMPGTHTIDLGVGGIARKPGVVGDRIAIREVLDLSIQVDHEMLDGAPAARFAARLTELMAGAFALDGSHSSDVRAQAEEASEVWIGAPAPEAGET
jgi:2-oxoacid dehydrogenases acyltransferase (catalytic domain)